jgi:hypothetical protein
MWATTTSTSTIHCYWVVTAGTTSTAFTADTDSSGNVWRQYDNARAEQNRQARVVNDHDAAANSRAEEILLAHLTDAQKETFRANKWFIVEGGRSKQRYRIRHTGHFVANIDVLGTGDEKVSHRLCAHCELRSVPAGDQLLAQKLMLELAEDEFLAIANRHAA